MIWLDSDTKSEIDYQKKKNKTGKKGHDFDPLQYYMIYTQIVFLIFNCVPYHWYNTGSIVVTLPNVAK